MKVVYWAIVAAAFASICGCESVGCGCRECGDCKGSECKCMERSSVGDDAPFVDDYTPWWKK